MTQRRILLSLAVLSLSLFGPGCGREPTPEELRADRLLDEARTAFQQRRYRDSRPLLAEAYTLDLRLGRIPQMADELGMLGHVAAASAQLDSALALFEASAARYRELTDRDAVRRLALHTATLHSRMGDDARAHATLTEALRLAGLFRDREGAVELRRALVPVCRVLERHEEEADHLKALLDEAGSDARAQEFVYEAMGVSALERGEAGRAEELLLRALTLAQQSNDSLRTIAVMNRIAIVTARSGRIKEAFEIYTEALQRSDRVAGAHTLRLEMLVRVGNIYVRNGVPADAVRFYRSALTSAIRGGDRRLEGMLFLLLGHCELAAGRADEALKNYHAALDLWTGLSYRSGTSVALTCLGLAAEHAGNLTGAADHYKIALQQRAMTSPRVNADDLLTECEQVLLGAAGEGPDDRLLDLLLRTGRNDDAFWYAAERQSRNTADRMALQQIQTGTAGGDSLLGLWNHARAVRIGTERCLEAQLSGGTPDQDLLREIQDRLGVAARKLEESAEAVIQMHRSLAPVVLPASLSAAEARKLLSPATALLLPVPTARSLYLVVLTSSGVSAEVAAIGRRDLKALAGEFTELLARRVVLEDSGKAAQATAERRIADLSATLNGVCIRPVDREISGVARLLIVAPPEYGDLPVHALRRVSGPGVRQYLIERVSVTYVPSVAYLVLEPVPARGERTVAGLGHPGESGADVEYELRDIRAFYRDAQLSFGRDATLRRLQEIPADVLHLAADIRPGERSDGNTRLILSDGKSAFTTTELSPGVLASIGGRDAFILSDLGKHRTGKNACLAGMLLVNGTGRVILQGVTPLRRAKKFMGELFYTSLLAGATAETAYQQTITGMLRNPAYAAPHFWAPFSLWGK